jgi:anti-sigma B factor antagonist
MEFRSTIKEREKGVFIVYLDGRLDSITSHELESKLPPVFDEARVLIFDLEKLSYISSMGIRVLLRAKGAIERNQGIFLTAGLQPQVSRVFDIVGFIPNKALFSHFKDDEYLDLILDILQGKSIHGSSTRKEELPVTNETAAQGSASFKDYDSDCVICRTFSGEKLEDLMKYFAVEDQKNLQLRIFESDNFAVICDPFPVVMGHVLVVPRKHFLSYANLPDVLKKEFTYVREEAKKAVGASRYFEFEHGAGLYSGTPSGCGNSVFHAHWHLIPLNKNIDSAILYASAAYVLKSAAGLKPCPVNFENEDNMLFLLKQVAGKTPYLVMKYDDLGFVFREEEKITVPSQILRMVASKLLSKENNFWDWKNMSEKDMKVVRLRLLEFIYNSQKKFSKPHERVQGY